MSITNQSTAAALAATLAAAPAVAAAPAQPAARVESVWDVDPGHASAQFKVRHLMVSWVRGHLGTMTGALTLDERDVERSKIAVSIDARGIDTRNGQRDEHLRSADFLDVGKHPNVTFHSTRVKRRPDGGLDVTGDLAIRGTTKPVTLDVDPLEPAIVDPWGARKRGVTARTRLNRRDFGLTWNAAMEAGGVVVGDEVSVELELELVERKR
jgi:polyisoprenoid-binding protein YceI